jgi:hypothetical protein
MLYNKERNVLISHSTMAIINTEKVVKCITCIVVEVTTTKRAIH